MPRLASQTPGSSTNTLQRISTSQLRPGMFLVRVLDSWWKSPFFVHRRLLKSPTDVQQLMGSGIREVEIDTSLGVEVSSEAERGVHESPSEETEIPILSREQGDSDADTQTVTSLGPESSPDPEHETGSEESKNREEVVQLREATVVAVKGAFEGVKTGHPISQPVIHGAAQALVQKTLAHPALVAEILLIDSLKQFDKTLYAHVVDTAVYAILVGLQLGWAFMNEVFMKAHQRRLKFPYSLVSRAIQMQTHKPLRLSDQNLPQIPNTKQVQRNRRTEKKSFNCERRQ